MSKAIWIGFFEFSMGIVFRFAFSALGIFGVNPDQLTQTPLFEFKRTDLCNKPYSLTL
jgi:hypothetical protein